VRALLVDQPKDRAGLVAMRSLAIAGFQVGTGSSAPSFASLSRHAGAHHHVRECSDDEDGFLTDVARAVRQGAYQIVFCTYEAGLMALSRERAQIAPALWPYPPEAVVRRSFDKLDLFHAVGAAGLRAPETVLANEQSLAAWAGPVVVKARNHLPHRFDTAFFDSAEPARQLVAQMLAEGGEPLLQSPLRGEMGAVVVLVGRDGRLLSEIHQRALHTWPPEAGDTVLGEVVAPDPALSRGIGALLGELGWTGLAQIEFFRVGDGVAITDFNGRFYGSMALAVAAGANLPAMWAREFLGMGSTGSTTARLGARFQWLNRDVAAGLSTGGVAGAIRALAAAPGAAHSMWDPRDPLPALRYLLPEAGRRVRDRVRGD
jgi:predicted ATP-grasp superfamily ATP-dependent carboligase